VASSAWYPLAWPSDGAVAINENCGIIAGGVSGEMKWRRRRRPGWLRLGGGWRRILALKMAWRPVNPLHGVSIGEIFMKTHRYRRNTESCISAKALEMYQRKAKKRSEMKWRRRRRRKR